MSYNVCHDPSEAGAPLISRQDLGVLVFDALGYARVRNRILGRRGRAARFLVFHDILPETRGRFEKHLDFLERKANVVGLDDFFASRLAPDRLNVVITFDDGYQSWISQALPLLKKRRWPAAFFVSSGFVGLGPWQVADFLHSHMFVRLPPRRISGSLSIDDVKRIAEEGFTIGGHTVHHNLLPELRDGPQLKNEIIEDKERLERMTGRRIEYFAYPSGEHRHPDIDLPAVLKEAGYKGAVTTAPGLNGAASDPFRLHRDLTDAGMPEWVFRARVRGNGDGVRFLIERLRRPVVRKSSAP